MQSRNKPYIIQSIYNEPSSLPQIPEVIQDGADLSSDINRTKIDINNNTSSAIDFALANQVRLQSTMGFPLVFGDGRDGDLTVTGTTYVDSSKQYNNVTIESGGVLTSHNKYLYLAIKGKLWIKSGGRIDMAGLGQLGGAGGYTLYGDGSFVAAAQPGINGIGSGAGVEYLDYTTRAGASSASGGSAGTQCGGEVNTASPGQASAKGGDGYSAGGAAQNAGSGFGIDNNHGGNGIAGAAGIIIPQLINDRVILNQNILFTLMGSGGGGGGAAYASNNYYSPRYDGGRGGNGGGVIYIEAYEIDIDEATTAITAVGSAGGAGSNGVGHPNFVYPNADGGSGGGGGGAGGCIYAKYHILSNVTSSNANLKISGGAGGAGGSPGSDRGKVGGIGGSGASGGSGMLYLQQI